MRIILTDDLCEHLTTECGKLNDNAGMDVLTDGEVNGSWLGECDANTCGRVLPMCEAKAMYERNMTEWKEQIKLALKKMTRAEESMKESNGYGFRYVGVVKPGIELPKCSSM